MIKTASLSIFLIPAVLSGCFFATKQDFDKLQQDIAVSRATSNAADSVQRAQLVDVSRSMRTLSDSIGALSRRVSAMRTATESDMAAMKEDINQLQDLSGQSEQRMRDVRAALEEKRQQEPAPVDTASGGGAPADRAGSATTAAGRDGPAAQGWQRRGEERLQRADHEVSDLGVRSRGNVLHARRRMRPSRNPDAADAQYTALISRYPKSPRVPTAMYKRALYLQSTEENGRSEGLFQDIIKRFPRSDEAALADERLQSIK